MEKELLWFTVIGVLCLGTAVVCFHHHNALPWKPHCGSWRVITYGGLDGNPRVLPDLSDVGEYIAKRVSGDSLKLRHHLGTQSLCKQSLDSRNCDPDKIDRVVRLIGKKNYFRGKKNVQRGKKTEETLKLRSATEYHKLSDPEFLQKFFLNLRLPFAVVCEGMSTSTM